MIPKGEARAGAEVVAAAAGEQPVSPGQVVQAVLARFAPRRRERVAQDVLQDVLELLEEGFAPRDLLAATGSFSPGRGAAEFARAVRTGVAS
jgi:hypothetical protein